MECSNKKKPNVKLRRVLRRSRVAAYEIGNLQVSLDPLFFQYWPVYLRLPVL